LWIRGRHNRPLGYMRDLEKYNTAANMGWRVLRFTPRDVKLGRDTRHRPGAWGGGEDWLT